MIERQIIDARNRAVDLWRGLKRPSKVGLNLRWLSRLHWYRGEAKLANDYIDQALRELEASPQGPELANAYGVRSQMHFLHDQTDEAISWAYASLPWPSSLAPWKPAFTPSTRSAVHVFFRAVRVAAPASRKAWRWPWSTASTSRRHGPTRILPNMSVVAGLCVLGMVLLQFRLPGAPLGNPGIPTIAYAVIALLIAWGMTRRFPQGLSGPVAVLAVAGAWFLATAMWAISQP